MKVIVSIIYALKVMTNDLSFKDKLQNLDYASVVFDDESEIDFLQQ